MRGVLTDIHLRPKGKCGCVCHCASSHGTAALNADILHTDCHPHRSTNVAATDTRLFTGDGVAVLRDTLYSHNLAHLTLWPCSWTFTV